MPYTIQCEGIVFTLKLDHTGHGEFQNPLKFPPGPSSNCQGEGRDRHSASTPQEVRVGK